MRTRRRLALGLPAFLLWAGVALQAVPVHAVQAPPMRNVDSKDGADVHTVDHFVPHTSTVPTPPEIEVGQVQLFVRERFKHAHGKRAVLMVHGANTSTVPVFDLHFEEYSWMDFLARSGFDVFAVDLTGYGGSTRPMMDDPCNTTTSDQQKLLIPNPLSDVCKPSYPFRLTSIQSDWDDIDAVVDFIRDLRDVETVSLIGWSRGGPRAGGYAARHPEKVDKLVLYAPVYKRTTLSDPPPPEKLPQAGAPMTVFDPWTFPGWDAMVKCADQFNPDIRGVISSAQLQFDTLGSTWGTRGVIRTPNQNTNPATTPPPGGLWGWNPEFAARVEAPTLIIRGDLDTLAPAADAQNLFEDLGSESKVSITVPCASHFLVWENQHMVLLEASRDWLRYGAFNGRSTRAFSVG